MKCEYFQPQTLLEAAQHASQTPGSMFMAGGTDLLVNKQQGNIAPGVLIDLSAIAELSGIEATDTHFTIGALTTLSDMAAHKGLTDFCAALQQSLLSVATPVIRQSATIGGNLLCDNRCSFYNQSEWWRMAVGYCLKCNGDICIATGGKKNCFAKFVSDTAPVLIALDARIILQTPTETRTIPLTQLYSGDGINPHNKSADTILSRIVIPTSPAINVAFRKLRPRKSLDFTSLTTAVGVTDGGEIRAVIGGVDPRPVMLNATVGDDLNAFIALCAKKPRIVDNDFYSRAYRKEMIAHFITQSLIEIGIQI